MKTPQLYELWCNLRQPPSLQDCSVLNSQTEMLILCLPRNSSMKKTFKQPKSLDNSNISPKLWSSLRFHRMNKRTHIIVNFPYFSSSTNILGTCMRTAPAGLTEDIIVTSPMSAAQYHPKSPSLQICQSRIKCDETLLYFSLNKPAGRDTTLK